MQLREKLPDQYDTIRLFAEALPGKEASPTFPFSGFAVNINVVTRAHRDVKDETLCVVLVVGSFDGGELVLWEPGLVLELQNGHAVAFPSMEITHFNLHFKGKRASLVLHTDASGTNYHKTRNGWSSNSYVQI